MCLLICFLCLFICSLVRTCVYTYIHTHVARIIYIYTHIHTPTHLRSSTCWTWQVECYILSFYIRHITYCIIHFLSTYSAVFLVLSSKSAIASVLYFPVVHRHVCTHSICVYIDDIYIYTHIGYSADPRPMQAWRCPHMEGPCARGAAAAALSIHLAEGSSL